LVHEEALAKRVVWCEELEGGGGVYKLSLEVSPASVYQAWCFPFTLG
jgi:hypothetical protein